MSHQTGICCSSELKEVFRDCLTNGKIRCVRVAIKDETLVSDAVVEKSGNSWTDEYDKVVLSLLQDKQPAILLYQMESKNEWLMITYSPDNAVVRQKMLYAATRSTLKQEFGGGYIVNELFGNLKADCSYEGFQQYLTHKNAPPPLTNAEEEMKFLEETESKSAIGNSTRHQTVQGIEFPITDDAVKAIKDFKDGIVNHVELNVDTEEEKIYKVSSHVIGASELDSVISKERAGYHIFEYAHRHNGEDVSSTVFIYYMPGYLIPIKARMLYSSCKAPLLDSFENNFQITFDRKLECDSSEVITEDYLRNEIHPPEVEKKQGFEKPKAPGRRAPTRRPR